MSRDTKQDANHSSIDAILKGLTSRPNVESTLILSRKDGTIIRATGFPQSQNSNSSRNQLYDRNQAGGTIASPSKVLSGTSKTEDIPEKTDLKLQPAQLLATAVYDFVESSSKVAASMLQVGTQGSQYTEDMSHIATKETAQETIDSFEDDVQLLRMRTRKQEIIIFPNPSYLCCVVQNLSRVASTSDTT